MSNIVRSAIYKRLSGLFSSYQYRGKEVMKNKTTLSMHQRAVCKALALVLQLLAVVALAISLT